MLIEKFYVIETGRTKADVTIDWYEDIKIEEDSSGYKNYQVKPFEYPIYTSFEEAEKACKGDVEGRLFEYCDYHARIKEYTYYQDYGYFLTHEWNYSHYEAQRQKSEDTYVRVFEKDYSNFIPK